MHKKKRVRSKKTTRKRAAALAKRIGRKKAGRGKKAASRRTAARRKTAAPRKPLAPNWAAPEEKGPGPEAGGQSGDIQGLSGVASVAISASVTVTSSGSMPKDHHTLRVVSARADLSGQRELAWVADAGQPVGDARCTQNFHIGPKATARVRPTLLVCWRTSPDRSVYTVAVDVDHRPSAQASVAVIDDVWSRLG